MESRIQASIVSRNCTNSRRNRRFLSYREIFFRFSNAFIEILSEFSFRTGHQPLQDIEVRVGNSSVELQRNPLCAWFPGTIGKQPEVY